MWEVRACRACLTTTAKLEKLGDASKRMYTLLTGIELKDGDGYPTYFCMECRNMIRKSLMFRRKCRRAYVCMKGIMTNKKQVTFNDISKINRKQMNLESQIGCFQKKKTGFFSLSEEFELQPFKQIQTFYTNAVDIAPVVQELKVEDTDAVKTETVKTEIEIATEAVIKNDVGDEDFDSRDNNDVNDDGGEDNFDISGIDMTDVFKDLNVNDEIDDDDGLASVFEFTPKNIKAKLPVYSETDQQLRQFSPKSYYVFSQQLLLANMRVLTDEEQRTAMEFMKAADTYRNADYKCSICLIVYDNLRRFMAHAKLHNKSASAKYCCSICKCKFFEESSLISHQADMHLYEYSCTVCQVLHYTIKDFLKHVTNAHSNLCRGKILSKHDDYIIKKPLSLSEMLKGRPNEGFPYQCNTCSLSFRSPDELRSHSKKHVEPKSITRCMCDICKRWCQNKRVMESHMQSHMYSYTCGKCTRVFYSKFAVTFHLRRCSSAVSVCDLCGKNFKSEVGLQEHREKKHREAYCTHHCVTCGASFADKRQLLMHQLNEHGYLSLNDPIRGKPDAYCKHCDVYFTGRIAYENHCVYMKHDEVNNFANLCLMCMERFDSKEILENHEFTCAIKKRKYPVKCQYCELVITTHQMFRKHMLKSHAAMRALDSNYVLCELCGMSCHITTISTHRKKHEFSDKVSLRCAICHVNFEGKAIAYVKHMVNQHTILPYLCSLCDFRFSTRGECRDHILKFHAPSRPFRCEFCQREFSHIDYLNDHSVKIHKKNVKKLHKTSLKMKGKFITYAHMKIDVSLIDKAVLDTVPLKLSDYLNKLSFPIENPYDFYVTTPSTETLELPVKPANKKTRKRKIEDITEPLEQPQGSFRHEENTILPKKEKPLIQDIKYFINNKPTKPEKVSTLKTPKKETEKQKKHTFSYRKETTVYPTTKRGPDMPTLFMEEDISPTTAKRETKKITIARNHPRYKLAESDKKYELANRDEKLQLAQSAHKYGIGDEKYGLADVDETYGLAEADEKYELADEEEKYELVEEEEKYEIAEGDDEKYELEGDALGVSEYVIDEMKSESGAHGFVMQGNVTEQGLVLGGNQPLQVTRRGGENYVVINQVLYRIETE